MSAQGAETSCSVPRGEGKADSDRILDMSPYLPKWLDNAKGVSGRGGS